MLARATGEEPKGALGCLDSLDIGTLKDFIKY
jgi:hypothetical protein